MLFASQRPRASSRRLCYYGRATELTAFLAEKVDKVKTITTEQFDLICQLIGGWTAFLVIIGVYSHPYILLAWLGMIVIMSMITPLQSAHAQNTLSPRTSARKGTLTSRGCCSGALTGRANLRALARVWTQWRS